MDDKATEEVKKKRPDKRNREREVFNGFPWEILTEGYSSLPNSWINLVACIENLSELKVVLYVMRHTWGFQEYDQFKLISLDEFINGRKRRDGTRMDLGTQLTEKAVINGLKLAVEHGFLVDAIDDSDPGRKKKFYKLKMLPSNGHLNTIQGDLNTIQMGVNSIQGDLNSLQVRTEYYSDRSKNELENQPGELTEENIVRISHPSENFSEEGNGYTPEFIRGRIEDFSKILGDYEHIGQNVSQANRIYRESGIDPDSFVEAMRSARELAQKASIKKQNSSGRPNRMPYFFRCLSRTVKQGGKN
jgi:hypothetical protein